MSEQKEKATLKRKLTRMTKERDNWKLMAVGYKSIWKTDKLPSDDEIRHARIKPRQFDWIRDTWQYNDDIAMTAFCFRRHFLLSLRGLTKYLLGLEIATVELLSWCDSYLDRIKELEKKLSNAEYNASNCKHMAHAFAIERDLLLMHITGEEVSKGNASELEAKEYYKSQLTPIDAISTDQGN